MKGPPQRRNLNLDDDLDDLQEQLGPADSMCVRVCVVWCRVCGVVH